MKWPVYPFAARYSALMSTILFACQGPPDKPLLAAVAAMRRGEGRVVARVASGEPKPAHPETLRLLHSMGLPMPDVQPFASFNHFVFDLIICFCEQDERAYSAMPGNPVLVRWNVPGPDEPPGDASTPSGWQELFARIDGMVDDLLHQGYLDALAQARKNSELLLENLSEGIVAHGLDRTFFFFNRAAEEITGIRRDEILGRDCHEVFPEKFCASHCSFCDNDCRPFFPQAPYPVTVRRPDGENRLVEMHVVPLKDALNTPIGVIASMRDITREQELARRLGEIEQFSGIIGRDPRMLTVFQTINELAESLVPVLILGESGTGKELVASAIHNEGHRAGNRFVPVNCGALPDTLLESELFGHVRGAFTSAVRDKKGRFELADGGTIFLDEIGDISPAMQVKLLRVLQDGVIQRLGGEKAMKVDVRVIAATHKNLHAEIEAGRFREDLYYRLCVVPVHLPPLRERISDLPLLTGHFLSQAAAAEGRAQPILSQATLNMLMDYSWPGNVRELQNIIRYLLVKCPEPVIEPHFLPPDFRAKQPPLVTVTKRKQDLKLDPARVRQALTSCHNNKALAARRLKVGRATLYRFLARHPAMLHGEKGTS